MNKNTTRKTQKQIWSGKKKQSANLNDLNAGQWRLPNLIEKKKKLTGTQTPLEHQHTHKRSPRGEERKAQEKKKKTFKKKIAKKLTKLDQIHYSTLIFSSTGEMRR